MCLPIDSWFCMPRNVNDDDYHHPSPPANKHRPPPAPASRPHYNLPAPHRNGNGAHQAPGTTAEADREASYDVRKGGLAPAHGSALKQHGARDGAADGARGVAHNNNYYYERQLPYAHREDAADFYYPAAKVNTTTTAATADHER